MKKKLHKAAPDDLRPEYDLRSLWLLAVGPGRKMPKRVPQTTRTVHRKAKIGVVVLDADVAQAFRTPREVNDTLRAVANILRQRKKLSNHKSA
jgi:hypothetical protein